MIKKALFTQAGLFLAAALATTAQAGQQHHQDMQMHMQHQHGDMTTVDTRTIVHFPKELRIHTLANMRDHLLALNEIQEALAQDQFEKAGEIAERRLGMSSLELHGAHQVSQYMPKAMAAIGTEMHHAASRFAVAASDAAVAGDIKPALAALSDITRQCVACHNGYRVQ